MVTIPPPPAHLPEDPKRAARILAGWAESLVAADHGGKTIWLRTDKARAAVARCVEALALNDVPPVDFLWWQLATWRSMKHKEDVAPKKQPLPPVHWLFSVSRVEKASTVEWGRHYTQHVTWPKLSQYIQAQLMCNMMGHPPKVVAKWLPLVPELKAEAESRRAEIARRIAEGFYVWG